MRAVALATALGLLAFGPATAHAWDPSTTHAGMVERAVLQSALHVRWMEGSGLQRGLFTSLRVDPRRLSPDLQRRIELAQRNAHADSGARGLGGPGACPGVSAPPSTRTHCVQGELWESTALGWIALGLIAEITPRERMLHHFVDPSDRAAPTWTAPTLPKSALRATQRRGDGPSLATLTRTAFEGTTTSAIGWLEDPDDPWAPPAMFEHLRKASMLADPIARQHHLALGLIGLGALLHVAQDASVPAHARGDLAAFVAPLSRTPGDRGLPLQEYARIVYGRTGLPAPLNLQPRQAEPTRGVVLAPTLREHLVGLPGAALEGLAVTAGARFLSEGTLPDPVRLPEGLDATEAAALLLQDSGLADLEREGATMAPWPAPQGYVLSAGGRPLAGFDHDELQRIRLRLDRRVYRDQIGHLVPLAIEASRSLVDLVFAEFPLVEHSVGGNVLVVDARNVPGVDLAFTIMIEGRGGTRRVHREAKLAAAERTRLVGAMPTLAEGERVVLVLRSTIGGHRSTNESIVAEAKPVEALIDPKTRLPPAVREPLAPEPDGPHDPFPIPPATDPDAETPPPGDPVPGKAPTDAVPVPVPVPAETPPNTDPATPPKKSAAVPVPAKTPKP